MQCDSLTRVPYPPSGHSFRAYLAREFCRVGYPFILREVAPRRAVAGELVRSAGRGVRAADERSVEGLVTPLVLIESNNQWINTLIDVIRDTWGHMPH